MNVPFFPLALPSVHGTSFSMISTSESCSEVLPVTVGAVRLPSANARCQCGFRQNLHMWNIPSVVGGSWLVSVLRCATGREGVWVEIVDPRAPESSE